MADLTKDLDSFLNSSDFAVSATYTPVGGSAKTVTGIYDDESIADREEVEIGERASQPTFDCKTSDVPNAAHDDTLTVGSQAHKVVDVDKNGTGVTTLILEKQ